MRAVFPNVVTSDLAKRTHFPIGFFVNLLEPVALGAVLSCAMLTKAFLFDVVSSLKTTFVTVLLVEKANLRVRCGFQRNRWFPWC